jgi:hypothetical protein
MGTPLINSFLGLMDKNNAKEDDYNYTKVKNN